MSFMLIVYGEPENYDKSSLCTTETSTLYLCE